MRFIDPNGETVYVKDGNNEYEYRDGKMWNLDGTEYTGYIRGDGFWDSIAKFFGDNYSGYVGDVFEALQNIELGGDNGKRLISDLINDPEKTLIQNFNNVVNQDGFDRDGKVNNVYWNSGFSGYGGDIAGNNTVSFGGFIALSHELGHSWDVLNGSFDSRPWDNNQWTNSEKTACGIENLIRAENGYGRRYYYYKNQGKIPDFIFPKK